MNHSLLLFSAAGVLMLGAQAHAANREVDAYLERASQTASADLAAAGVEVPTGLRVKARVDFDGRLSVVKVVDSSGSLETDLKATKALKHFRVAAPPLVLVGATVNVAIGPQPIVTAKAP